MPFDSKDLEFGLFFIIYVIILILLLFIMLFIFNTSFFHPRPASGFGGIPPRLRCSPAFSSLDLPPRLSGRRSDPPARSTALTLALDLGSPAGLCRPPSLQTFWWPLSSARPRCVVAPTTAHLEVAPATTAFLRTDSTPSRGGGEWTTQPAGQQPFQTLQQCS